MIYNTGKWPKGALKPKYRKCSTVISDNNRSKPGLVIAQTDQQKFVLSDTRWDATDFKDPTSILKDDFGRSLAQMYNWNGKCEFSSAEAVSEPRCLRNNS